MQKARHMTPNVGQMRSQQFSGYTPPQPGGRTWHNAGLQEGCPRGWGEQSGGVVGSFHDNIREGAA